MFYEVSKALAFATIPSTWAVALLGAAAVARRRVLVALALVVGALAVLCAFSSPVAADHLQRWVESSARTTSRAGATYDAVVILGGDPSRVEAAGALMRARVAPEALYSGAMTAGDARRVTSRFRSWGLPDERFVVETRSRNTHENAVESARLARERGWRRIVIVTSAAHVERALGSYRAAGLDPDVFVADRRAPPPGAPAALAPTRAALGRSSAAMHEIVGRVVYRAMGYAR